MKFPSRCFRWLALLAWAAVGVGGNAWGSEPVDLFLNALRKQLYFDEALDYLELLKSNASLPDDVKQKLAYEQGLVVLESAAKQSAASARNTQLAKASGLFEEFSHSFPKHSLAASAKTQIANILIERGRTELQSVETPEAKPAAQAAARKFFDAAREQFSAAEKDLDAQWRAMPKLVAPTEKELQEHKRQLTGDLAQVRLLLASIDYELAQTHEAASGEAKKHLKIAAQNFAKLYETYRTRAAGLLARLWEGRCYQELGEIKQALGCYQELMDLPASSDTRELRTKSTRHALECWTKSSEQKYPEAIQRGERWEKESDGNLLDADALAIRYLTALAYQAQSDTLPAKDPNRKKLASHARQQVSPVAEHPGEFQHPAKMLLVALADKKTKKNSDSEPSTFAKAFERANQVLEKLQEPNVTPKQKAALAAQAEHFLRLALSLSDAKTSSEDLNSARWYLCFLAWDAGDYYGAAVLGEFLAHRYPDSQAGRKGARVALSSFVRLYGSSKSDDKAFEVARIQHIADLIFKSWPNEEEADEAALTLLSFAASQQQLDKVVEYLGKISPNSPRRGQAELRAGQTLWSAYLRALQTPAEQRPAQEKLDALKKQAQEVLSQGVARLEKAEEVDASLITAVVALAQIYVEDGQGDKAIQWLEHPKIGPLKLMKGENPLEARADFATEVYKVALRAYISVTPQQLKKAEEVMDALEKLAQKSGDEKAAGNLTAIYISLGRDLQQHLLELQKSGKNKELEAVSKAFEVFLDRITQRETGGSSASLHWVAETYFGLGTGFDKDRPQKAKTYFEKAGTAYQRMLEIAEKDPKYQQQPDSLLGMRLRLAECFYHVGKYDEAIQAMVSVLRQKPMLVTAQVRAAEIHQASGELNPKGYVEAIMGSNPGKDGTNIIWGWNKISKRTENNSKFEETFYQARLNMAEARYQFALKEEDNAKRNKILEAAKQDLWITYQLHPDLGGKESRARFDQMLKQIQKHLGIEEAGLAEFEKRDAETAKEVVQ